MFPIEIKKITYTNKLTKNFEYILIANGDYTDTFGHF